MYSVAVKVANYGGIMAWLTILLNLNLLEQISMKIFLGENKSRLKHNPRI